MIELLGSGSMARVYLAKDQILDREVAVKVIKISADLRDDERDRMLARFVREYQVTAALEHPNVVTIFDVGEHEGEPFIAMEYVRGQSLETVLAEDAPMTPGQVFDLFAPIADALDHAHRHGIVHRDLKPANVLLTESETPKVMDFGLAKVASTTVLTRASSIVGTPAYMSPEQVTGHEMTGASDQFALATILFRALTGERPFTGNTATTIMYKIVNEDPIEPHHINRRLPDAVGKVVLRGLAKNAADRFTTCRDLIQAVIRALHDRVEVPASPSAARSATEDQERDLASARTAAIQQPGAGASAVITVGSVEASDGREELPGSDGAGWVEADDGSEAAGESKEAGERDAGWLDRLGIHRLRRWVRRLTLPPATTVAPHDDRGAGREEGAEPAADDGNDEVDVAAETVQLRRRTPDDG